MLGAGAGAEAGFKLCCWTDGSLDLPGKAMAYQDEVAAGSTMGYLMENSDGGRRDAARHQEMMLDEVENGAPGIAYRDTPRPLGTDSGRYLSTHMQYYTVNRALALSKI